MKKRIMLNLMLILCFVSACSRSADENVSLYDETFVQQSDNWEVSLHLKELSGTWSSYKGNQIPYEEDTLVIKYLKDIDEGLEFSFKWNYGDPVRMEVLPGYTITLKNQTEFVETLFQQKMIEEVCFGTLTLEIYWENDEGETHEESFVFKDHQNPQCQHIVIMAPRG